MDDEESNFFINLPAARRGDDFLLLVADSRFRLATLRIMSISLGDIAPLAPEALDRGDRILVMIFFLGAKERRLEDFDDLDDLLEVLVTDLVDLGSLLEKLDFGVSLALTLKADNFSSDGGSKRLWVVAAYREAAETTDREALLILVILATLLATLLLLVLMLLPTLTTLLLLPKSLPVVLLLLPEFFLFRCCWSCRNRAMDPVEADDLKDARDPRDFLDAAESAADTAEAAEAASDAACEATLALTSDKESLQVLPRSSYIFRSVPFSRCP